eukprot:7204518-Prymnesium_polylepis.1
MVHSSELSSSRAPLRKGNGARQLLERVLRRGNACHATARAQQLASPVMCATGLRGAREQRACAHAANRGRARAMASPTHLRPAGRRAPPPPPPPPPRFVVPVPMRSTMAAAGAAATSNGCLLYTSPSPRDAHES